MKVLIVLCLVAAAVSAPAPSPQNEVQLIRYESDNIGRGSYRFAFEQTDGTRHEEQGELKNEGSENEFIAVSGVYSWVGPDGVTYIVTYKADENGYQPTIEQGPGGGVPPAVVASLLG